MSCYLGTGNTSATPPRSPNPPDCGLRRMLTDQAELGFIAQEVEKVAPEAVTAPKKGASDLYSLKESELVPFLIEAVKEQQA